MRSEKAVGALNVTPAAWPAYSVLRAPILSVPKNLHLNAAGSRMLIMSLNELTKIKLAVCREAELSSVNLTCAVFFIKKSRSQGRCIPIFKQPNTELRAESMCYFCISVFLI